MSVSLKRRDRIAIGCLVAALVWINWALGSKLHRHVTVTATAYNSVPDQTLGDPTLAAWGDTLKPGMRAIAVSRDLIDAGLGHRASVRIDGMPGKYHVLDKMNRRWEKRIDIYMGDDVKAAREFGKREVVIRW